MHRKLKAAATFLAIWPSIVFADYGSGALDIACNSESDLLTIATSIKWNEDYNKFREEYPDGASISSEGAVFLLSSIKDRATYECQLQGKSFSVEIRRTGQLLVTSNNEAIYRYTDIYPSGNDVYGLSSSIEKYILKITSEAEVIECITRSQEEVCENYSLPIVPSSTPPVVKAQITDFEAEALAPIYSYLKNGGDIEAKNEKGNTLLEVAVYWDEPALVSELLARGAAPDRRRTIDDECDYINCGTAVYIAAARSSGSLLLLIEAGADVNYRTKRFGFTPLYNAAIYLSLNEVKALLAAGADVNYVNRFDDSALRAAIDKNRLDIAALLLEAGADVHQDIGDSLGRQRGNTILMDALRQYFHFGDIKSIELLLRFGADPNDKNSLYYDSYCDENTVFKCTFAGYTPLTLAAKQGWQEVVETLIAHGANPFLTRTDGKTAAEIAREHGHVDVAKYLSDL